MIIAAPPMAKQPAVICGIPPVEVAEEAEPDDVDFEADVCAVAFSVTLPLALPVVVSFAVAELLAVFAVPEDELVADEPEAVVEAETAAAPVMLIATHGAGPLSPP